MKTNFLLLAILFSQLFFSQKKETLIEQELKHHKEMGAFKNVSIAIFENIKHKIINKDNFFELTIQPKVIERVIEGKNKFISINIPFSENSFKTILLKKRELFSENFKLITQTANGKIEDQLPNYIAYSGIVDNETENTMASLTFVNNTLRGIISIGNKEYTIGPKNNKDDILEYILYEKNDIQLDFPEFACGTEDISLENQNHNKSLNQQATIPKCVNVHFEVSRYIVSQNTTSQIISYVVSTFNQVQTLYANENITMRMSRLILWQTQDPYIEDNRTFGLTAYNNNSGAIDGNIGCLLNGKYQGGIAYLGSINCRRIAVCGIDFSSNGFIFPNYSWDVNVIAHELGHTLGSNHTHWCGWNGGALDNCYAVEGSCSSGPAPMNGGTIMSYCHLASYGINFNNGFGTQPGDVVRNSVNTETCFTSCETPQACEDNIVSNVQISDNGLNYIITWNSLYPVKIYRRESNSSSFVYVTTVSTSTYTADYITDCNIEKSQFKLVSVCPNGDSKPTVLIVSPLVKTAKLNTTQTNLCTNYQNDTRTISIQNSNLYTDFQWQLNGNLITGANSSTYIANQLGVYTCLATTSGGCSYTSDSVTFTQDLPTSAFTVTKTGLSVNFTNNSSCSYQRIWDFGDGSTSTALNPSHTYSSFGVYNVCLTNTNLAGSKQQCEYIPFFNTSIIEEMNNSNYAVNNNTTYNNGQCSQAVQFTRNSATDNTQNTSVAYPYYSWIPRQGTLEFLVNVSNGSTSNGTSSTSAYLLDLGSSTNYHNFIHVFTNGRIEVSRSYPGYLSTYVVANTSSFTFNQWHIISISYGNLGTKIAVDGVVYATNTAINYNMFNGNLVLGHFNYDSSIWYGFEGLLDRFRISNTQNDFQLNNLLISPTFTQVAAVSCGATLAPLPTTSINGITGTWSPALNNATTTTYTFTPTTGQCASNKTMTITVNITPQPTLSTITSCSGLTVGNITSSSSFLIYNAATGGNALPNSTIMSTGNYYITQTQNGCESARKLFSVTINSTSPPTAIAQNLCNGATVANLSATGTALKWFNVSTGGSVLPNTTILSTGTYYVSQTLNSCESNRTSVNVTINTTAMPVGNSNQSFTQGQTIADIVISGFNIVWYGSLADATNNINSLPTTTQIVNGNTYYAIQTQNGCRSSALAVTVSVTLTNIIFEANDFLVYPNPFNDKIIISSVEEIQTVKMYDLLGRKIKEENRIDSREFILNLENLPPAVYILQITSDKGKKSVKVVKK